IYSLWLYQRTMTGPVRPEVKQMPDLGARELWAVGPLVALLVVFGFFPQPLLNIINPAVSRTLVQVHATDPVPPHPASSQLTGAARLTGRTGQSAALSPAGAAGRPDAPSLTGPARPARAATCARADGR